MVLFYDTEPARPPASRRRKYIGRFFKVVIGFGVFVWVSLWVLSTLGGNGNALRLGIQDYLSNVSGYLAEMGKLEDMQFFPMVHVQFSDLVFYRPVKKEESAANAIAEESQNSFPQPKGMTDFYEAGERVASIGSGNLSMNFWDMFLSRRRLHELSMANVSVNAGIWLPKAINLQYLKIVPDADFPAIAAVGTYGKDKLDVNLRVLKRNSKFYEIADETPFKATLGSLSADGTLLSAPGKAVEIKLSSLTIGKTIFTGDIVMKGNKNKNNIVMDLKSGQSQIKADLTLTALAVTGTITADVLDMRDIEPVRKAYGELMTILGLNKHDDRVSFGNRTMDIDLAIKKLMNDQQEWGDVKADLIVQPYVLNVENIIGLINGGALKGHLTIDASGKEPNLKAEAHLRGWDYARLQTEVTGQADTHLTLSSAGPTLDALEKNLKGELVTIGGVGELTSDSALYWGEGLINAMLPRFSDDDRLKMNCMVADFDVHGTTATVQTLFMDLSDLTIVGDGSIDLDDMILDLRLKPQSKDVSALNGGVAVSVKGPFSAPRIQPDRFSLGKRIGGMLLGTLNPAFFALSLTDLGLTESHPCRAYIKQP